MPDTRDRVRRLKDVERHISPETEHGIEKVRSMWTGNPRTGLDLEKSRGEI
jgi:hypothetical protein